MASHSLFFLKPLSRTTSLPDLSPVLQYSSSYYNEEETESESDDDITEETDGSAVTPGGVSSYFRSIIPSFGSSVGSPLVESPVMATSSIQVGMSTFYDTGATEEACLTTTTTTSTTTAELMDESVDHDINEASVKRKPNQLILQPTDKGTFEFINNSPSNGQKVSTVQSISGRLTADNRTSSCLDFSEFNKKQEQKQRSLFLPRNVNGPNLHRVKSAKKLLELLEHPLADPNARDKNGDAPLHSYISRNKQYRAELLIAILSGGRNTDVNIRNEGGHTPLHIAVQKNDIECVKILLVFEANLNIVDVFRQTAYDMLADENESLRNLMDTFVAKPGFIHRNRVPTISSPVPNCQIDMIGYRLACRRETQFAIEIEERIKNMLHQCGMEDPSEAGAAFLQWNNIIRWRQTKGRHVRPGSRVLFLDGGGVRGLVLIEILIEIEKRTGQKITELFDWIVGTSTGGIVALGLVYAGLTLSELRGLFFQLSQHVFKKGLFGLWLEAIPNSLAMQSILQSVFKDKMMYEVTEPKVLISAVHTTRSSYPLEFFNNYEGTSSHLSNVAVWQVARMTSAAPMYFVDYQGYIDGGLKANNPCDFGMGIIRQYYETRNLALPHFPVIVSVGTGIFPSQKLNNLNNSVVTGLLSTVTDWFKLFMSAISMSEENAKHFRNWCHSMQPPIPFVRFNPPFDEEIKPNETDTMLLVDMLLKTKQYMIHQDTLNDLYNVVKIFEELQDFH